MPTQGEVIVTVVDALRKHGRMTRADLIRAAGIGDAAARKALRLLESRGWVRPAGVVPKEIDVEGNKRPGLCPTLWECCL